mgnify:CR=1 FL=1
MLRDTIADFQQKLRQQYVEQNTAKMNLEQLKEKEGEIFNRLKQSNHLKPGLSFIADAPTVIEANPNAGIDKPTKCLTYRIGEDHEDRFVTLEFVHYCPELDKLFEYDPITDDYFEIVAQ